MAEGGSRRKFNVPPGWKPQSRRGRRRFCQFIFTVLCATCARSKRSRTGGWDLIEDAAHCIEGMRDGVRPGELSDVACFSFYATKNLTCGGSASKI
jgi:hypothetical protein